MRFLLSAWTHSFAVPDYPHTVETYNSFQPKLEHIPACLNMRVFNPPPPKKNQNFPVELARQIIH